MFDIDSLRIDPEKASEGVWVPYRGGSELKIAKFMNAEMKAFRNRKSLEHASLLEKGDDEAEQFAEDLMNECLATFVLKDWKGFEKAGEKIEYSSDLGKQLFSNPEYADFREDIINLSVQGTNFKPDDIKSATKAVKKTAAS